MSGISFATDNFQDIKTSALAFETAAILMKNGAIRVGNIKVQKAPVNTERFFPHPTQSTKPLRKIEDVEKDIANENPPEDWLAPKIYKGSTNF
jgi:c-di-AMP phosphodiesterase-like protein